MMPIYLYPTGPLGADPAVTSRFWGFPDLPRDFAYPVYIADGGGKERPYVFVCQINLSEAAPYDRESLLPHEGLLSFFAKIDPYLGDFSVSESVGGCICRPDDVKVFCFPSCEGMVRVAPPVGADALTPPVGIGICFGLDPRISSDDHALFAPPTHRPWETWDHPFEKWQILLQVDSFEGEDFELNFMDVGVLDFLIAPSDLAGRRFDRVRAVVLSS